MGDAVQVSKKTVINWEQDATAPDANQLMRLHALRFNVIYLLFGMAAPSGVAKEPAAYTPAEHAALALRGLNLSEEDAKMVVQIAKRFGGAV